jgi:hypothetical protein
MTGEIFLTPVVEIGGCSAIFIGHALCRWSSHSFSAVNIEYRFEVGSGLSQYSFSFLCLNLISISSWEALPFLCGTLFQLPGIC